MPPKKKRVSFVQRAFPSTETVGDPAPMCENSNLAIPSVSKMFKRLKTVKLPHPGAPCPLSSYSKEELLKDFLLMVGEEWEHWEPFLCNYTLTDMKKFYHDKIIAVPAWHQQFKAVHQERTVHQVFGGPDVIEDSMNRIKASGKKAKISPVPLSLLPPNLVVPVSGPNDTDVIPPPPPPPRPLPVGAAPEILPSPRQRMQTAVPLALASMVGHHLSPKTSSQSHSQSVTPSLSSSQGNLSQDTPADLMVSSGKCPDPPAKALRSPIKLASAKLPLYGSEQSSPSQTTLVPRLHQCFMAAARHNETLVFNDPSVFLKNVAPAVMPFTALLVEEFTSFVDFGSQTFLNSLGHTWPLEFNPHKMLQQGLQPPEFFHESIAGLNTALRFVNPYIKYGRNMMICVDAHSDPKTGVLGTRDGDCLVHAVTLQQPSHDLTSQQKLFDYPAQAREFVASYLQSVGPVHAGPDGVSWNFLQLLLLLRPQLANSADMKFDPVTLELLQGDSKLITQAWSEEIEDWRNSNRDYELPHLMALSHYMKKPIVVVSLERTSNDHTGGRPRFSVHLYNKFDLLRPDCKELLVGLAGGHFMPLVPVGPPNAGPPRICYSLEELTPHQIFLATHTHESMLDPTFAADNSIVSFLNATNYLPAQWVPPYSTGLVPPCVTYKIFDPPKGPPPLPIPIRVVCADGPSTVVPQPAIDGSSTQSQPDLFGIAATNLIGVVTSKPSNVGAPVVVKPRVEGTPGTHVTMARSTNQQPGPVTNASSGFFASVKLDKAKDKVGNAATMTCSQLASILNVHLLFLVLMGFSSVSIQPEGFVADGILPPELLVPTPFVDEMKIPSSELLVYHAHFEQRCQIMHHGAKRLEQMAALVSTGLKTGDTVPSNQDVPYESQVMILDMQVMITQPIGCSAPHNNRGGGALKPVNAERSVKSTAGQEGSLPADLPKKMRIAVCRNLASFPASTWCIPEDGKSLPSSRIGNILDCFNARKPIIDEFYAPLCYAVVNILRQFATVISDSSVSLVNTIVDPCAGQTIKHVIDALGKLDPTIQVVALSCIPRGGIQGDVFTQYAQFTADGFDMPPAQQPFVMASAFYMRLDLGTRQSLIHMVRNQPKMVGVVVGVLKDQAVDLQELVKEHLSLVFSVQLPPHAYYAEGSVKSDPEKVVLLGFVSLTRLGIGRDGHDNFIPKEIAAVRSLTHEWAHHLLTRPVRDVETQNAGAAVSLLGEDNRINGDADAGQYVSAADLLAMTAMPTTPSVAQPTPVLSVSGTESHSSAVVSSAVSETPVPEPHFPAEDQWAQITNGFISDDLWARRHGPIHPDTIDHVKIALAGAGPTLTSVQQDLLNECYVFESMRVSRNGFKFIDPSNFRTPYFIALVNHMRGPIPVNCETTSVPRAVESACFPAAVMGNGDDAHIQVSGPKPVSHPLPDANRGVSRVRSPGDNPSPSTKTPPAKKPTKIPDCGAASELDLGPPCVEVPSDEVLRSRPETLSQTASEQPTMVTDLLTEGMEDTVSAPGQIPPGRIMGSEYAVVESVFGTIEQCISEAEAHTIRPHSRRVAERLQSQINGRDENRGSTGVAQAAQPQARRSNSRGGASSDVEKTTQKGRRHRRRNARHTLRRRRAILPPSPSDPAAGFGLAGQPLFHIPFVYNSASTPVHTAVALGPTSTFNPYFLLQPSQTCDDASLSVNGSGVQCCPSQSCLTFEPRVAMSMRRRRRSRPGILDRRQPRSLLLPNRTFYRRRVARMKKVARSSRGGIRLNRYERNRVNRQAPPTPCLGEPASQARAASSESTTAIQAMAPQVKYDEGSARYYYDSLPQTSTRTDIWIELFQHQATARTETESDDSSALQHDDIGTRNDQLGELGHSLEFPLFARSRQGERQCINVQHPHETRDAAFVRFQRTTNNGILNEFAMKLRMPVADVSMKDIVSSYCKRGTPQHILTTMFTDIVELRQLFDREARQGLAPLSIEEAVQELVNDFCAGANRRRRSTKARPSDSPDGPLGVKQVIMRRPTSRGQRGKPRKLHMTRAEGVGSNEEMDRLKVLQAEMEAALVREQAVLLQAQSNLRAERTRIMKLNKEAERLKALQAALRAARKAKLVSAPAADLHKAKTVVKEEAHVSSQQSSGALAASATDPLLTSPIVLQSSDIPVQELVNDLGLLEVSVKTKGRRRSAKDKHSSSSDGQPGVQQIIMRRPMPRGKKSYPRKLHVTRAKGVELKEEIRRLKVLHAEIDGALAKEQVELLQAQSDLHVERAKGVELREEIEKLHVLRVGEKAKLADASAIELLKAKSAVNKEAHSSSQQSPRIMATPITDPLPISTVELQSSDIPSDIHAGNHAVHSPSSLNDSTAGIALPLMLSPAEELSGHLSSLPDAIGELYSAPPFTRRRRTVGHNGCGTRAAIMIQGTQPVCPNPTAAEACDQKVVLERQARELAVLAYAFDRLPTAETPGSVSVCHHRHFRGDAWLAINDVPMVWWATAKWAALKIRSHVFFADHGSWPTSSQDEFVSHIINFGNKVMRGCWTLFLPPDAEATVRGELSEEFRLLDSPVGFQFHVQRHPLMGHIQATNVQLNHLSTVVLETHAFIKFFSVMPSLTMVPTPHVEMHDDRVTIRHTLPDMIQSRETYSEPEARRRSCYHTSSGTVPVQRWSTWSGRKRCQTSSARYIRRRGGQLGRRCKSRYSSEQETSGVVNPPQPSDGEPEETASDLGLLPVDMFPVTSPLGMDQERDIRHQRNICHMESFRAPPCLSPQLSPVDIPSHLNDARALRFIRRPNPNVGAAAPRPSCSEGMVADGSMSSPSYNLAPIPIATPFSPSVLSPFQLASADLDIDHLMSDRIPTPPPLEYLEQEGNSVTPATPSPMVSHRLLPSPDPFFGTLLDHPNTPDTVSRVLASVASPSHAPADSLQAVISPVAVPSFTFVDYSAQLMAQGTNAHLSRRRETGRCSGAATLWTPCDRRRRGTKRPGSRKQGQGKRRKAPVKDKAPLSDASKTSLRDVTKVTEYFNAVKSATSCCCAFRFQGQTFQPIPNGENVSPSAPLLPECAVYRSLSSPDQALSWIVSSVLQIDISKILPVINVGAAINALKKTWSPPTVATILQLNKLADSVPVPPSVMERYRTCRCLFNFRAYWVSFTDGSRIKGVGSGSGVFIDDPALRYLSSAFATPSDIDLGNGHAELLAAISAVATAPLDRAMVLVTDAQFVHTFIHDHLYVQYALNAPELPEPDVLEQMFHDIDSGTLAHLPPKISMLFLKMLLGYLLVIRPLPVFAVKLKSHNHFVGNDNADSLAKMGASNIQPEPLFGPRFRDLRRMYSDMRNAIIILTAPPLTTNINWVEHDVQIRALTASHVPNAQWSKARFVAVRLNEHYCELFESDFRALDAESFTAHCTRWKEKFYDLLEPIVGSFTLSQNPEGTLQHTAQYKRCAVNIRNAKSAVKVVEKALRANTVDSLARVRLAIQISKRSPQTPDGLFFSNLVRKDKYRNFFRELTQSVDSGVDPGYQLPTVASDDINAASDMFEQVNTLENAAVLLFLFSAYGVTPCSPAMLHGMLTHVKSLTDEASASLKDVAEADAETASVKRMYAAHHSRSLKGIKREAMPKAVVKHAIDPHEHAQHLQTYAADINGFPTLSVDFGPSPGVCDATADAVLHAPITEAQIREAWKGKAVGTMPYCVGKFGISYTHLRKCRCEKILALMHKGQMLFDRVQPDDTHVVTVVIPKNGAGRDYAKPKAWREISFRNCFIKTFTTIEGRKMLQWLVKCQKMSNVLIASRKGIPATLYGTRLVQSVLFAARHLKRSAAVGFADISQFYPRITVDRLAAAMSWVGFPQATIQRFRTLSTDKSAALVIAGKIVAEYDIEGMLQGCSSSVIAGIIVTLPLAIMLERLDIGVTWPTESLGIQAQPKAFGAMCVDDIACPVGLSLCSSSALTPDQCIDKVQTTFDTLSRWSAMSGLPFERDKAAVVAMLFDSKGNSVVSTRSVSLLTNEGQCDIPVQTVAAARYDYLGLRVTDPYDSVTNFNLAYDDMVESASELYEHEAMPAASMADALDIVAAGKLNYVLDKTPLSCACQYKMVSTFTRSYKVAYRLGASTSNAYVFTHVDHGGLGCTDPEAKLYASAAAAVLTLANSQLSFVRELFAVHLALTRRTSKYKKVDLEKDTSTFFNFAIRSSATPTSVRRARVRNDLILLLEACLRFSLVVVPVSIETYNHFAGCTESFSWALAQLDDDGQVVKSVYKPRQAAELIKSCFHKQRLAQFMSLTSSALLAKVSDKDHRLSNAWRIDRTRLSQSALLWSVKAAIRALPTPANLALWTSHKAIEERILPRCPHCSERYATLMHILSCCPAMESLKVYHMRHNEICKRTKTALLRSGWKLLYEDQVLPDRFVGCHLRDFTCHTRPDFVFTNQISSTVKLMLVVDAVVTFETQFALSAAWKRKTETYRVLLDKIEEVGHRALILPVVVGALGTIPEWWVRTASEVSMRAQVAIEWARQCSATALVGSQQIFRTYQWLERNNEYKRKKELKRKRNEQRSRRRRTVMQLASTALLDATVDAVLHTPTIEAQICEAWKGKADGTMPYCVGKFGISYIHLCRRRRTTTPNGGNAKTSCRTQSLPPHPNLFCWSNVVHLLMALALAVASLPVIRRLVLYCLEFLISGTNPTDANYCLRARWYSKTRLLLGADGPYFRNGHRGLRLYDGCSRYSHVVHEQRLSELPFAPAFHEEALCQVKLWMDNCVYLTRCSKLCWPISRHVKSLYGGSFQAIRLMEINIHRFRQVSKCIAAAPRFCLALPGANPSTFLQTDQRPFACRRAYMSRRSPSSNGDAVRSSGPTPVECAARYLHKAYRNAVRVWSTYRCAILVIIVFSLANVAGLLRPELLYPSMCLRLHRLITAVPQFDAPLLPTTESPVIWSRKGAFLMPANRVANQFDSIPARARHEPEPNAEQLHGQLTHAGLACRRRSMRGNSATGGDDDEERTAATELAAQERALQQQLANEMVAPELVVHRERKKKKEAAVKKCVGGGDSWSGAQVRAPRTKGSSSGTSCTNGMLLNLVCSATPQFLTLPPLSTDLRDLAIKTVLSLFGSNEPSSTMITSFILSSAGRTVYAQFRKQEVALSDALYAAVADVQDQLGLFLNVDRSTHGGGRWPCWPAQSRLAARWPGWHGLSTAHVNRIRLLNKIGIVLDAIKAIPGSCDIYQCDLDPDHDSPSLEVQFTVSQPMIRKIWRQVSRQFRGKKGTADDMYLVLVLLWGSGMVVGDFARRGDGGRQIPGWRASACDAFRRMGPYPEEFEATALSCLQRAEEVMVCRHTPRRPRISVPRPVSQAVLWVLDLFSGFNSAQGLMPMINKMVASMPMVTSAQVVGVDIEEVLYDCAGVCTPTIAADLFDFTYGFIAREVAAKLTLDIRLLLHIFMSSPCQTNSLADASNSNRGCSHRIWRKGGHCPPRDPQSSPYGKLALLHDRLEKHVVLGIAKEAEEIGATWTAENPAYGAFRRKLHLQCLFNPPYRHVVTCHCAYGWVYKKPTVFAMAPRLLWCPKMGDNGMCLGVRGCKAGELVDGRWRHHHAIAQASYRGYSSASMGRARAKNHIPLLLLEEIVEAAREAYLQRE